MAGRDARPRVVRRGAALRHLYRGSDPHKRHRRAGLADDDAFHYTEADRARIVAAYPPHEREARAKGIPSLGSGRIFPVEEAAIAIDAFDVPRHWPQIAGIDFG